MLVSTAKQMIASVVERNTLHLHLQYPVSASFSRSPARIQRSYDKASVNGSVASEVAAGVAKVGILTIVDIELSPRATVKSGARVEVVGVVGAALNHFVLTVSDWRSTRKDAIGPLLAGEGRKGEAIVIWAEDEWHGRTWLPVGHT